MRRLLLPLLVAALLVPAEASAGDWAVGLRPGDPGRVAGQLPGATTLVPGRALLVEGSRPHVAGAAYVERLDGSPTRRLLFDNTEPDSAQQWYLSEDHAWDFWPSAPQLAPVKVAVIDSGIDYAHPEFFGRILTGKSFVGGSWKVDTDGHGTFVAGEIAADAFNGQGIAGMAFNAQLLIAKVVEADGSVSLKGEVEAIRWAADHGARVINLSLGGVRDPVDSRLDTFSPAEEAAIEYAYGKGAVLVAAVGNGPQSPSSPWTYADYPAALPHVIGVSALRQDGAVPDFSNRDAVYNDIAAPGDAILSTIPRNLVDAEQPGCAADPYSDCGPAEFRDAIGTSFAAPQVTAAAALVLGEQPDMTPDQTSWLLERSAVDESPATGCTPCTIGRDSFTGWGRLDVAAALGALASGVRLPTPDRFESNDDAGRLSHPFGPPRVISASLDFWDDQVDVYSIVLSTGQRLYARLTPSVPGSARLVLWKPGTASIEGLRVPLANRAADATPVGTQERLAFSVPASGRYYLEAKQVIASRDPVIYQLAVATRRP